MTCIIKDDEINLGDQIYDITENVISYFKEYNNKNYLCVINILNEILNERLPYINEITTEEIYLDYKKFYKQMSESNDSLKDILDIYFNIFGDYLEEDYKRKIDIELYKLLHPEDKSLFIKTFKIQGNKPVIEFYTDNDYNRFTELRRELE